MADILSLSKARKAKTRVAREATAAGNRAKFGQTRAEKERDALLKVQRDKIIDSHKRDA